jgi:hypothetical protein
VLPPNLVGGPPRLLQGAGPGRQVRPTAPSSSVLTVLLPILGPGGLHPDPDLFAPRARKKRQNENAQQGCSPPEKGGFRPGP